MKTCAPSATNRFAVPRPMPALPPVTTAILPSSLPANACSSCLYLADPGGAVPADWCRAVAFARHSSGSQPFDHRVQIRRVGFGLIVTTRHGVWSTRRASRDLPEGASLELQASVKARSRLPCTRRLPCISARARCRPLAAGVRVGLVFSDVRLITKNDQLVESSAFVPKVRRGAEADGGIEVLRCAAGFRPEAGSGWCNACGDLPAVWDQPGELLQLEEEV
jgi:hypothetical protein